jgi:hypothetical protein
MDGGLIQMRLDLTKVSGRCLRDTRGTLKSGCGMFARKIAQRWDRFILTMSKTQL